MKRNVINAVFGTLTIVIIFAVVWFIFPAFFAGGYGGAIGGIIGGVLGGILFPMYMKKYRDERFTRLMEISTRNMAWFLVISLPWAAVIMIFGMITMIQAAALIFGIWFAGLGLLYVSLYYYYKR